MLRNIAVFFCRLGVVAYLSLRLYQVKSWLYRWVFERKYRDTPLPTYTSMDDLVAFIHKLIWVADSWQQLWDAFSYPGKVQWIGTEGDRRVGDCDEFAIYSATAILKANAAGYLKEYRNPRILTACWMDSKGKLGGHNVCLLERDGGVAYMDYGDPIHFDTLQDLVASVIARYTREENGACIGWGVTDPVTLRPIEVHWS